MKLRDDQWQKLEPLLIGKKSDPGVSAKNNRLFIEAVFWIVLDNGSWCNLPLHFGKWNAAYMRFRRWNECDFWRQLAQSKLEDQELRLMLEQVVGYGDLYTRRIEQRSLRKAKKMIYTATISAAKSLESVKRSPLSSDESTSHWVGLVMPQA